MHMASPGWSSCIAVAGDEKGYLYGVARSGSDPGTFVVLVADVSASTSKPQDAQGASIALNDASVVQVLSTTPPIQFDVTAASASADGHQLLLVGNSREENSCPVLALVDIYSSFPAPDSSSSQHAGAKHKLANLMHVHEGLYSQRQGLRILQASWHPSSSSHFATLSTDNRWRLYHTARLTEAEQTFALHPPGGQLSLGLRRGLHSSSSTVPACFTAFAFGPPGTGCWASLAVLFLASNGGVYLLCPVAPFGMRLSSSVLQKMLDQSDGTAHSWLLAAFLAVLAHESDAVSARPHMLETAAPALQGPLNSSQDSLKHRVTRSIACTLSVSNTSGSSSGLAALSLGSSGRDTPGFSVLATGFSNGVIYAHALEVGQIVPSWLDATPQCVYDRKGEVMAVRYEVESVATQAATASGLAAVPEDNDNSPAAAAAGASNIISPLLLVDCLKINLHLDQAGVAAAADDDWDQDDTGSPTDSEEESDAGYDPSAAAITGRGARSSSGNTRLGFGTQGLCDSDEDDDLEDQQLLQLRRVTLHAAPDLPGRFWACHDQGCWGINIRWLQEISNQLNSATASGYFQQQQDLPAPQIQELLVSDSQVSGSCVVGNALFGSGCVMLENTGRLSYIRPRPAGVLDGEGPGAPAGDDDQGLALAEIQLSPEELDVKGRMEEFYADICRGPRRLPGPTKPANLSQLTAADPAGLEYLNAMTKWLLQTQVQFATGAHADMKERVKQLYDEVHDQVAAAAQLQQLAAAVTDRQADLDARLDRLGQISTNLAERSSLLAGLHWTLPRHITNAEKQLDKQLEVWEQQRDELKLSWRSLRNRIDAYAAGAAANSNRQQQQQQQSLYSPLGNVAGQGLATPGSGTKPSSPFLGVPQLAAGRASIRSQVTKPPTGPVASQQLERLKELLEEQTRAIADARERLAGLFDDMEAWKVEHPEVQLPGRLRGQAVL